MQYLKLRPGVAVPASKLERPGFLDDLYIEGDGVAYYYPIIRLVYTDNFTKSGGCRRYLASSMTSGDLDTFWPVVFYTLGAHTACLMDGTSCLPESSATFEKKDVGVLLLRSAMDIAKIMDRLAVSCYANSGIFRRVSFPESRESSSELSRFLYRERKIFCQHGEVRTSRSRQWCPRA